MNFKYLFISVILGLFLFAVFYCMWFIFGRNKK